jgi:hypothetical protein
MKRITRYARPMGLLLALLVLAGAAAAQNRGRMMGRPAASEFQRFSLSLAGGFGFQERGCGMADLKAELQYGFSRSLRLGFSVGYLTRGDRDDMMDREGRGRMNGGMMMDNARLSTMLFPRQEQEFGRDARAIPLGLNLYYTLPVGAPRYGAAASSPLAPSGRPRTPSTRRPSAGRLGSGSSIL